MTARERITAAQNKIPEPWVPEFLIEGDDNLPEVLEELADQLGVMNDFYYPLLAAAAQLKPQAILSTETNHDGRCPGQATLTAAPSQDGTARHLESRRGGPSPVTHSE
jgi:hypothetical protein